MFVKHVLFDFFKKFLFQFFNLFGLERKLLLVVIGFIYEEDFILRKVDAFLIGHNFFIDTFVSLFSKHEIITHFLKNFSEGK